jgi:NAD(P)H-dependent FMN reductase
LKNALDYLYYEWKDKPAAIVTYGGRGGGGKAADHLCGILQGLRMNAASTTPGLVVKVTALDSVEGQQVGVEDKGRWRESGAEEQISSMFLELLEKVHSQQDIIS